MASTMTCGELKNTIFLESGSGDNSLFGKVSEKFAIKEFESDDDKKVYQVRPGARIVKLKNIDEYNSFKQELSVKMNIPIDKITSIEDILKAEGSIYDGIMIGHKLKGDATDPILANGGLQIFNKDALAEWKRETVDGQTVISKEDVHNPMRSHFKADGTEITDRMRELSESLYNDREKILEAYNGTSALQHGGVEELSTRITAMEKSINEALDLKLKLSIDPSTVKVPDKITDDEQWFKMMRIEDTCKALGYDHVDARSVRVAQILYDHYSNIVPNYNHNVAITNLEDSLKQIAVPSENGNAFILNPDNTRTQANIENTAGYNLVAAKTAEDLHREKQIWDRVISSVNLHSRQDMEAIAKVSMLNTMQAHIDVRKSETGYINFGDKKVNFTNDKLIKKNKEASKLTSIITTKLTSFRQKLKGEYEKKKSGLEDEFKKKAVQKLDGTLETIDRATKTIRDLKDKLNK